MAWYQGFGCANNGDVEVVIVAILDQLLLEDGVGQMSAVPREKVVHPVNDCESQMGSVGERLLGELKEPDDVVFKQVQIFRDRKFWDLGKIREPTFCR